jgi:hypothetical protein
MNNDKELVKLNEEVLGDKNPLTYIRTQMFKMNQTHFGAVVGCSSSYISRVECLGTHVIGDKLIQGLEGLGYDGKQVNDLYVKYVQKRKAEMIKKIS